MIVTTLEVTGVAGRPTIKAAGSARRQAVAVEDRRRPPWRCGLPPGRVSPAGQPGAGGDRRRAGRHRRRLLHHRRTGLGHRRRSTSRATSTSPIRSEEGHRPNADAHSSSEVDAATGSSRYGSSLIALETIRYGLIEIARDMHQALLRGAFSPCGSRHHGLHHLRAHADRRRLGDGRSREGRTQHAFTCHICNFVMAEWDEAILHHGDVILDNDPGGERSTSPTSTCSGRSASTATSSSSCTRRRMSWTSAARWPAASPWRRDGLRGTAAVPAGAAVRQRRSGSQRVQHDPGERPACPHRSSATCGPFTAPGHRRAAPARR